MEGIYTKCSPSDEVKLPKASEFLDNIPEGIKNGITEGVAKGVAKKATEVLIDYVLPSVVGTAAISLL